MSQEPPMGSDESKLDPANKRQKHNSPASEFVPASNISARDFAQSLPPQVIEPATEISHHHGSGVDYPSPLQTVNTAQEIPTRTSLEELQQWPLRCTWPETDHNAPLQSPLPPSTASSINSTTSISEPFRSSLEQISPTPPEETELPSTKVKYTVGSRVQTTLNAPGFGGTSRKRSRRLPKLQEPLPSAKIPEYSEADDYQDYINQLATSLPNFDNVATIKVRHDWSSRLVLHDRIRSSSSEVTTRHEPWQDSMTPSYREFNETLKNVSVDCIQRMIIVEDLAPSLIRFLGATFQIPAHVFEEHLKDSGYQVIRENQKKAASWDTHSSAQGFFSITWYRAVMPIIPITPRFRTKLIMDRKAIINCVDNDCDKRHNVHVKTSGNIWRHNLDLSAEPGVYHKGSQTEYPVGWEERATMWSRKIGTCNFVILLLDPLPVLLANQDNKAPVKQQTLNNLPLISAFLSDREVEKLQARRSKPLEGGAVLRVQDWVVQSPSVASNFRPGSGASATSIGSEKDPVRFSWSSRRMPVDIYPPPPLPPKSFKPDRERSHVTGANTHSVGVQSASVALRRRATKPQMDAESITESQAGHEPAQAQSQEKTADSKQKSFKRPSFSPPRSPSIHRSQMTDTHGPFVPYHPIKARSSSAAKINEKFTARQIRKYARSLQVPTSTLEEFDYFLQLPTKGKETTHDPFRPLFRVIHDDTQSLADIIRVTSQHIREDTMDEDLMQKRVTDWRRLLHRLNVSLADIDQRLRAFATFYRDFDELSVAVSHGIELPSEKFAADTRDIVRDCINILDRSLSSLLSEMQIVDSRRSIAEAKSVAKLTELAFVFIPLSFVASLFSMQVDVLEVNVPVYRFVLVAIALVTVVYAIRLSIRSSRILDYKRKTWLKIQDDSHLQYNQPIPTRIFLAWVGKAMRETAWTSIKSFIVIVAPAIIVLAVLAAIVSPVVLFWLRGFNKGFAAVITMLVILLDVVLVYPVAVTASGKLEVDPKRIVRGIQRNLELKKLEKKRAKKRERERQGTVDTEAQSIDSSDESHDDVDKPMSSGVANLPTFIHM